MISSHLATSLKCSFKSVPKLHIVFRAPALPPVGRWEKGAPVLPEERARTKPSAPFSGHCVPACHKTLKVLEERASYSPPVRTQSNIEWACSGVVPTGCAHDGHADRPALSYSVKHAAALSYSVKHDRTKSGKVLAPSTVQHTGHGDDLSNPRAPG